MVIHVRNLEWLNHNSQRAYPLAADATRVDVTDSFTLPEDFLLAMYLPVHWGNNVEPGKFFLRKIQSSAVGFSLVIGYAGTDGDVEVATALITRAAHEPYQQYLLAGIGDFADSRGHIVIGDFDNIDLQPAGLFVFDLEGGRLEPDVVRPNIQGVVAIQGQNGGELTPAVSGFVRFRAGDNFKITVNLAEGRDPELVFDAIEGEGLSEDCICEDERVEPIRTVNKVGPDSRGNLNVIGNDCLEVSSGGDGVLNLRDLCSEPCCGCTELEAVTQALMEFGEKATTLENFLVSLEARVTQMDQVVLGSRLGDRGCPVPTDCP
jgi:hypothetical protein